MKQKSDLLGSSRLLLAFGVCIAPVIFVGIVAFLLKSQSDFIAAEREQRAKSTLDMVLESRKDTLRDYTAWDEFYQRVVIESDADWFHENSGADLGVTNFWQATLVIDETGAPVLGSWGDERQTWRPETISGDRYGRLLGSVAATGGGPQATYFESEGVIRLIAIAEVLPHSDESLLDGAPGRRFMVILDSIDSDRLDALRSLIAWDDLQLVAEQPGGAHHAIRDLDGAVVGFATWQPPRIVHDALRATAPLAVLGLSALVVSLYFVFSRLDASTRAILTEKRRAHVLAHTDMLTGLANRRALAQAMQQRLDAGLGFQVLVIDFDGFKEVNDRLGHKQGDALLVEMSGRMMRLLGEGAFLARLGGDEFAVVLDMTAEEAAETGRDLVLTISQPFRAAEQVVSISASIGHAGSEEGIEAGELLRRADVAMYSAKALRCGAVHAFEPAMDRDLVLRRNLDDAMRRGLDAGEFSVVYQPLGEMASGEIIGVEALLRWHSATHGDVSPELFIPVAEETRFILTLGEFVLRTACAEVARKPGLVLSVNLSPVQLLDDRLVDLVSRVLEETGLEPTRLELEITEGYLIEQEDRAARVLQRLRALGARISLDDFGTGYASIGYLKRFPIDKIKIDRSLIPVDESDTKAYDVANAVIALCRALNLPITAEGVETPEQAAFLREANCDYIQGYLIGRPVAALPKSERQGVA